MTLNWFTKCQTFLKQNRTFSILQKRTSPAIIRIHNVERLGPLRTRKRTNAVGKKLTDIHSTQCEVKKHAAKIEHTIPECSHAVRTEVLSPLDDDVLEIHFQKPDSSKY